MFLLFLHFFIGLLFVDLLCRVVVKFLPVFKNLSMFQTYFIFGMKSYKRTQNCFISNLLGYFCNLWQT